MSAEGLAIPLCSPRATTLVLAAGEATPFLAEDWRDAMVLVQRGSLQVRCLSGRTTVFERGSVLCFQDVPLAELGARGAEVVLLVVRR